MPKHRYDLTKAPVSLLAKVIKESNFLDEGWGFVEEYGRVLDNQEEAIRDLREAARVPLRTRAQVDADIAKIVRANGKLATFHGRSVVKMCDNTHLRLHALLIEDCLDDEF